MAGIIFGGPIVSDGTAERRRNPRRARVVQILPQLRGRSGSLRASSIFSPPAMIRPRCRRCSKSSRRKTGRKPGSLGKALRDTSAIDRTPRREPRVGRSFPGKGRVHHQHFGISACKSSFAQDHECKGRRHHRLWIRNPTPASPRSNAVSRNRPTPRHRRATRPTAVRRVIRRPSETQEARRGARTRTDT